MKTFRMQEHTPDTYSKQSRDFQLLCNVFDCLYGAVKYDIDAILDTKDTTYCNDKLLNLLQTKLGFFSLISTDAKAQRIILKGFPYVIKNKGSIKGIMQTIQLFLKSQNVHGEVTLSAYNEVVNSSFIDSNNALTLSSNYSVKIATNVEIENIKVLDELLKYIIPAGYTIEYAFYDNFSKDTKIENSDKIRIIFANDFSNRRIKSDENFYGEISRVESGDLKPYGHTSIGGVSGAKLFSYKDKNEFVDNYSFDVKDIPEINNSTKDEGDEE